VPRRVGSLDANQVKILATIFLLCCLSANAATYYVDQSGGSDAADGLTTSTPWQTWANATNTARVADSDTIAFLCNRTWSGVFHLVRNRLLITSYGSGTKPIFEGASAPRVIISGTSITNCIVNDLIIRNGGTGTGALVQFDYGTNWLLNCIVTNHLTDAGVSGKFVVCSNTFIGYCKDDGFTLHDNQGGRVQFCTIAHNAQGINNSGTNIQLTVEDTLFYNNTNSAAGPFDGTTLTFRRNTVRGRADGGASKLWDGVAAGTNVTVEYCLFDASQASSQSGPEVNIAGNENFVNCTFYGRNGANNNGKFTVASTGVVRATNTIFSQWYRISGTTFGGTMTMDHCDSHGTFDVFAITSETSGSTSDPVFVTPGSDYQLQSTSPFINAAVDLNLTNDIALRPVRNFPDYGANEYFVTTTPTNWITIIATNLNLTGQGAVDGFSYWSLTDSTDTPVPTFMGWMKAGYTSVTGLVQIGRSFDPGWYVVIPYLQRYSTTPDMTVEAGGGSVRWTTTNEAWRGEWQQPQLFNASVAFSNLAIRLDKNIDIGTDDKGLLYAIHLTSYTNHAVDKFENLVDLEYVPGGVTNIFKAGNILENSSFELGWRHGWWNATDSGRTNLSGLIVSDPHSGTYAALLRYQQALRTRVQTLRSNHVYTFSFWVKGTNASNTKIEYGYANVFTPPSGYTDPWPAATTKLIGTSWTRVSLTNVALHYPESQFYYYVGINNDNGLDTVSIDDIQLEEGDATTTYAPVRAIEVAFATTNAMATYIEGQSLTAGLRAYNSTVNNSNITVAWNIYDSDNRWVTNGTATFTATASIVTTNSISIDPGGKFGTFSLISATHAYPDELSFSVVRAPRNAGTNAVTGTHHSVSFGTNGALLYYAQAMRPTAEWGRMFSHAGGGSWDKVENGSDNAFVWNLLDSQMHAVSNSGCKFFLTLYQRPSWDSSAYPNQTAWRDYVSNTVSRVGTVTNIIGYEIDNEPQGRNLTGLEYATMLSNAIQVIRIVDPTALIIACGGMTETNQLGEVRRYLAGNSFATAGCDAVAVHMYPGGESKTADLKLWCDGLPMWNTESGSKTKGSVRGLDVNPIYYLDGIYPWVEASRYFWSQQTRINEQAQCMLTCLGAGCSKFIYYESRLWANDFDHQYSDIEQDDSLRPMATIRAATGWFLDGFTVSANLSKTGVPIYAWTVGGTNVAALWVTAETNQTMTGSVSGTVWDLYGNQIQATATSVVLARRPVYITSTSAWAMFTNAVGASSFSGSANTTAPKLIVLQGRPVSTNQVQLRFAALDDVNWPQVYSAGVEYRYSLAGESFSGWSGESTYVRTVGTSETLVVESRDSIGNTSSASGTIYNDGFFEPPADSSPSPFSPRIFGQPPTRGMRR
jgi:hypothetical protein